MPTLLLTFPGGRYHATPWGHHVNEGLVEWPPSPWRIIRALLACGYATQGWNEPPAAARTLCEALASTLPRYILPPASLAHSRHFMPTGVLGNKTLREKTTLVFDTWADVGQGALAIRWNCALAPDAQSLFAALAEHLGYLGRSESWVIGRALPDDAALAREPDAYPHVDGHRPDRGWEQVSLMAPEDVSAYGKWRADAVSKVLAPFPLPEGKKTPKSLEKSRAAALAPYPVDLDECLQRDTAWWKAHRWSQPPGSRRVLYWRRTDALQVGPAVAAKHTTPATVTTMLLALTTPSGSRSSLPPLSRALPQAELLHRALIATGGKGSRMNCSELTGKDSEGAPLKGHRHAHLLPLDLDGDGHLDHIVVHAPMGLGPVAQEAIRSLKRTWTKGGVGELQVALAGQGDLRSLRQLPSPLGESVAIILGEGDARTWTTISPFVPPRHAKRRGANTVEGQVLSELASRGLPSATVEVLPWDETTRSLRHAVRVRRYPAKPPPVDAGFAVRLVFAESVPGPITLGYGSHFGLGLFAAKLWRPAAAERTI